MSPTETQLRARNLRTLTLLAGLFLLPLLLAFWTYYASGWRPTGHSNHGDLVQPVRPLPQVDLPAPAGWPRPPAPLFHGKWSLLYVGSGECDAACRQALYVMRQSRLALNNDMARVVRVFLVSSDCCTVQELKAEHAGLVLLDGSGPAGAPLLAAIPAERQHMLLIVDPLGNLMMRYDARGDPRGLLQDLKKLLSLSHIG
jgi:cytochrome oxidase Cu insertion factor (SCO1/SenC/PrrC family)